MRILLLQPSQSIIIGRKKKNGSIMPPLGLLSLAAAIRKESGDVQIDFFDYEVKNSEEEPDFSQYDIVGLSGTSVHIPHANILIKEIRLKNADACIIIGGPHATFSYTSLLRDIPELDVVILGEGEISLSYLIKNYKDRKTIPEYAGIVTRKTEMAEMSPIIENLDELPEYAYDLVDINKYQLSTHRKALKPPFISYMTSRGCPFSCQYCQTPNMFGNNIRYRSAKLVYEECRKLKQEKNYNSIVFWDDTFTSSREYAMELCLYLGKLNVKWMCNTRVDRVDKELLYIMKNAGCEVIFFGVESFHEPTLKWLKRTTNEQIVFKAFRLCKEVGIQTVAALMIGSPYDTLESIDQNVNKLKELQPDKVYISIYNVTVGSKEFKRAIMSGELDENIDWLNPKCFIGPPYGLPTVNPRLNRFQLQKAQKSVYKEFYGKGNEIQYE